MNAPVPQVKEQLSDALVQDLEAIALQEGTLEAVIERYGSKGSLLTVVDAIRETFPDDRLVECGDRRRGQMDSRAAAGYGALDDRILPTIIGALPSRYTPTWASLSWRSRMQPAHSTTMRLKSVWAAPGLTQRPAI